MVAKQLRFAQWSTSGFHTITVLLMAQMLLDS
jgi:hypothetical protein